MKKIITFFIYIFCLVEFAKADVLNANNIFDGNSFAELNSRAEVILNKMYDLNISSDQYIHANIKDQTIVNEIKVLRSDLRSFVLSSNLEIQTLVNKWHNYSGLYDANSLLSQLFIENFLLEIVQSKNNQSINNEADNNIFYNWFWVIETDFQIKTNLKYKSNSPKFISAYNLTRYALILNLITKSYHFNDLFSFSPEFSSDAKKIILSYFDVYNESTLQKNLQNLFFMSLDTNNSIQYDNIYSVSKSDLTLAIKKLNRILGQTNQQGKMQ